MKKQALTTPSLTLAQVKKGAVIRQFNKMKSWVVTAVADYSYGKEPEDQHFEITVINAADVEKKLPNPESKIILIKETLALSSPVNAKPQSFNEFFFVEKRKIKKSVVKSCFYSPKIRKNMYGESDLYTFTD